MNRDRCIKLIRTGSAKFCANDVKISFPKDSPLDQHHDGYITCREGRFRLSLRALPPTNVEPLVTKFVGASDFGTAKGLIDGSMIFRIPRLQPSGAHNQVGRNVIQHFNFDRLDFSDESPPLFAAESVEVNGLLEDFELIAPEEKTSSIERTPFGETESTSLNAAKGRLSEAWSYALVQREKDLEFILLKGDDNHSKFDDERRVTEAFLKSMAFIHGQHGWPIWMRHRRDGKYIFDWIRPPHPSIRSPHRPFNERIWFNARIGQITWRFNDALLCAFNFFVSQSELANEIAQLLHQLREATSGGPVKRVNNIVLCALLESAVNAIYEDRAQSEKMTTEQEFDRLRIDLIETIRQKAGMGNELSATKHAGERLIGILSNASYWHAREKFQTVVGQLGLEWCEDWENLYHFWNKWRHPVIHRAGSRTDDDDFTTFKIQSRFAGAIHLLTLRAMGYRGIAIKSVFEDAFARI